VPTIESIGREFSDGVLIERSLAFDDQAIRMLYDRYASYVRGAIVSAGTDPDDAEDCEQETWIRVIRGLPYFRGSAKFEVWLWRIARNVIAQRWRSHSRRRRALEAAAHVQSSAFEHPLENVGIRNALSSIPGRMRAVLLLAAQGYSHADIAQRLGIAEGTSKSQLAKARAKMRSLLG
jgi:RNA polymerase sigma-70 factor, ECF subfamily